MGHRTLAVPFGHLTPRGHSLECLVTVMAVLKAVFICLSVLGEIWPLTASQGLDLMLSPSLEENLTVRGSFGRDRVDIQDGVLLRVTLIKRDFQLSHQLQILTA